MQKLKSNICCGHAGIVSAQSSSFLSGYLQYVFHVTTMLSTLEKPH